MTDRDKSPSAEKEALTALLERSLMERYGPMVGNDDLRVALGYNSMDAFRQALSRGTVPVPVFSLQNRRGKFALTRDIATWLAAASKAAGTPHISDHEEAI